jgi:hypothetical protein
MKKLSLFSLVLIALEYSVMAQSVLIRPNSASPLSVKSSVTNYGNISTTSSNANLVFRINEPANGSGASGNITGAIESSGTEVSYNGYSGDVGLYGSLRLRLGTNNNRDRMIMLSNGNVGINWTDPRARLEIFQTSPIIAPGWGGYVDNGYPGSRGLKGAAFFNGTHTTLNQDYDAIGVAAHGNWASVGDPLSDLYYRNIGVLGTAGNTAHQNIGVYGYINQSSGSLNKLYGLRGDAIQSGSGETFGVYARVGGTGNAFKAALYATVDFNTPGTNYAGYFSGNVYVGGTFSNPSDERFKKNLNNIEGAIGKLMQLIPAAYEYKTDEFSKMNFSQGKHYGFTAQNVKKVFPQLVSESALPFHSGTGEATEQYLSVNYLELIPVLTKAIQEQQLVIEKLTEEVRKLRK